MDRHASSDLVLVCPIVGFTFDSEQDFARCLSCMYIQSRGVRLRTNHEAYVITLFTLETQQNYDAMVYFNSSILRMNCSSVTYSVYDW